MNKKWRLIRITLLPLMLLALITNAVYAIFNFTPEANKNSNINIGIKDPGYFVKQKVTFDANGCTFADGTTTKTVEVGYNNRFPNELFPSVTDPDNDPVGTYFDLRFVGWFTDDTEFNASTWFGDVWVNEAHAIIKEDITVYAQMVSDDDTQDITYQGITYHYQKSTNDITVIGGDDTIEHAEILGTLDQFKVTEIGASAFKDAKNLKSISFPDTIEIIREYAFQSSGLNTSIILPNNLSRISYNAFQDTAITDDLILPSTLKEIQTAAFSGCTSLTGNLVLPNTIATIGNYAFADCKFTNTNFTVPSGLSEIGVQVFSGNQFSGELTIPNTITTIKYGAFSNCDKITSISFSDTTNLTTIESSAFISCSELTGTLIIPDSVTSIGDYVFQHLDKISTIYLPKNITASGIGDYILTERSDEALDMIIYLPLEIYNDSLKLENMVGNKYETTTFIPYS